jgi:LysR family nitrogen assimilation transcriptional regulator
MPQTIGATTLDFKQLRYFLSLVDAGSFSKAAVMLGIGQPALSRYIRMLEDELGVELLYRNGRGIVLTDSGKVLHDHAKTIVEHVSLATTEIQSLRSVPSGRVIIGVPPTVGYVLIVPLVRQLKREFPKVTLQVMEGYSGHVMEWLSLGRIDIAVLYNAPRTSTLNTEPLIEEELFLVGPANDPAGIGGTSIKAADIAKLPVSLPSHPHGLRVLVDSIFARLGVVLPVEYEIEALAANLKLAEEGGAYTILPYAAVHPLVVAGKIRTWTIESPQMKRQLVLATSTQRPMTLTTRTLAKIVRLQVQSLAARGEWTPKASPEARAAKKSAEPRPKTTTSRRTPPTLLN